MGKIQNSVVVLWNLVKFWWMIPMGVTYNHRKIEQETQWWRPKRDSQVADIYFEICQKWPKNAVFFGQFGCLGGVHGGLYLH